MKKVESTIKLVVIGLIIMVGVICNFDIKVRNNSSLSSVCYAKSVSQDSLISNVKNKTNDEIVKVFFDDFDKDGTKEAFLITKESEDLQSVWFSSEKQTKMIVGPAMISYEQPIARVSKKQKLFIVESGYGGSGSVSNCFYVDKGNVIKVKRAGEGLKHISGKDFSMQLSAFDDMLDGTDYVGHTWKKYYFCWNGKEFVEYVGKIITKAEFKKYKYANKYLRQIAKTGYKVGRIYKRTNGIINVNVSRKEGSVIYYSNANFSLSGKKMKLLVNNKKGKDIIQKSGYGGIYQGKGF